LCSTKLDSSGDGCIAATQTVVNGQRGIATDPWGHVFLPGFGDHITHVIFRTASPLCTPAQVGTMQAVPGCVTNSGTSGTTGTGLDNTPALTLAAGTCSTSLGEINTPRGIAADLYGNVYIAETATFRYRVVLGPQ